jgi:hypothetical protein
VEFALGRVDVQLPLAQPFEDGTYMLLVRSVVVTVNQDVVEIDHTDDVNEANQGPVDVGLERRWGICKAKGHNSVFEMAVSGTKRSLPLIACADPKPVVCILQV